MTEHDFLSMLSRLTAQAPQDLDEELFPVNEQPIGTILSIGDPSAAPISPALWERSNEAMSFIGVRETRVLDDYTQVTSRLLSAALERGVAPIILTTLGRSGFTRFGLRVERLSGDTDATREASEAQIKSLWNLAIIIDAEQVAALG